MRVLTHLSIAAAAMYTWIVHKWAHTRTRTHTRTHKHTHARTHTHTHTYTQEQQGWVKAASEVQQVGTVTLQDLHTLQVTDATRSRAYPGGMSDIASFFLFGLSRLVCMIQ